MSVFEIKKNHLVGEIADFPMEVVERMVYEQVTQGQKADPAVFAKNKTASDSQGGFTWSQTSDGIRFWRSVVGVNDFDVFFERYPKKYTQTPDSNLVYAVGDHKNYKKVIDALIKHGGVNKLDYKGDCETNLYYIEPTTNLIRVCDIYFDTKLYEMIVALYTQLEIDTTVEVSMEDIAKMMGVDVSDIRIKK